MRRWAGFVQQAQTNARGVARWRVKVRSVSGSLPTLSASVLVKPELGRTTWPKQVNSTGQDRIIFNGLQKLLFG
jgi:hypothetical protein